MSKIETKFSPMCLAAAACVIIGSPAWSANEISAPADAGFQMQIVPADGGHRSIRDRLDIDIEEPAKALILQAQSSSTLSSDTDSVEPLPLEELSEGSGTDEVSSSKASETELTVWNDVKDSNLVDELNIYLELFPDGVFAPLARIRIEKLERQEELLAEENEELTPDIAGATEDDERSIGLNRSDLRDLQMRLRVLGFDPKGIDGRLGNNSRQAIRNWQTANSNVPSGYLTGEQYELIKSQSEPLIAAAYRQLEEARQAEKSRKKKARATRSSSRSKKRKTAARSNTSSAKKRVVKPAPAKKSNKKSGRDRVATPDLAPWGLIMD